jgi:hypothetical protein
MTKKDKKKYRKQWTDYCKVLKAVTKLSKETTKTWRSTIKIEHPSTTWLGRIAQKRRIRKGEIQILEHFELSTSVARELFPWLFRVLDRWPYSTIHPIEQMRVDSSYSLKSKSYMVGNTSLYHQKQLVEQVEWTISLCNGEADLTVRCSKMFSDLLARDMLTLYLQSWL